MSTAQDPQLADELNQGETNTEDTQAVVDPAVDQTGESQEESKAQTEESSDEQEERALSRRQRAELRRQHELQALMDKVAFLERLAVGQGKSVEHSAQVEDQEPRIEDFGGKSIEEYIAARDKHLETKLVRKATTEAQLAMQREKVRDVLNTRMLEARKELPDWDEVMLQAEEDGIQVSPDAVSFIAESELGPKIAYFLAKNPDEHERINKLSPTRRIAELGKLEDKLATKKEEPVPTKKVTSAPTKLSNTQGKPALTPIDPASAARQGYAAWKAADEARKAAKAPAKKR